MGPLERFLSEDHARLDAALRAAVADPARIDPAPYTELRAGLLRHIAMEEKVLLPEARARRGGRPLDVEARLRADHSLLATLFIPTPTHALLDEVRTILEAHNALEEGPDGIYAACEALLDAGAQADVLARVHAVPQVRLGAHTDTPAVHAHLEALRRARARELGTP